MDGVCNNLMPINIFLHDNLEEEIYMEVPPGFKVEDGKMCKLRKHSMDWNNPLEYGLADLIL